MTDIENNEDKDDDKDSGTESDVDCAGCPEPTPIMLLTQNAKDALTETIMKRTFQDRDKFANTIDPNIDLFIKDFGAEKLKEPGRHAKIPIRRQNRNELYLTKKFFIFIRFRLTHVTPTTNRTSAMPRTCDCNSVQQHSTIHDSCCSICSESSSP